MHDTHQGYSHAAMSMDSLLVAINALLLRRLKLP
jgi:hypothetical protein